MEDERNTTEEMGMVSETCVTERNEETSGIGTGAAMLLGAALAVGVGAGGKKLWELFKQRKEKKLVENLEKVEDAEVVDSSDEEESK